MRLLFLVLAFAAVFAGSAQAGQQRPFRGAVGVSVLLCQYKNAPAPARTPQFFAGMLINQGTGGHADYWQGVSNGSITLAGSVVKGWYTLDQTAAEAQAYGSEGKPPRIQKHTDCVNKARASGYTPPAGHLVVVITSPGIDAFGFNGGAFLAENSDVGIVAHEVGHGMSLEHSYSDDPNYCNATWATAGEYGNQWDVMSYANVFGKNLGAYGSGGPGLNAYHLDRMGWLDRNKIFRFGADGVYDRQVTLTALTRPNGGGHVLARVPFDVNNPYRYYTVEYRVAEGWDGGVGTDRVLIHEVNNAPFKACSDGSSIAGGYRSYLVREHTGAQAPREAINLNGVQIDTVSKNAAAGQAVVRIRSTLADHCVVGFVWREASPADHVCVTPQRRAEVRQENQLAPSRRQPGGGAYGPNTCQQGYVWREAFAGDFACVVPASRTTAANENRGAFERRIGGAFYGPNTCAAGFVWREADARDWVCVSPQRRAEVAQENALAPSRRQPGGAYGPNTCQQGFVWREAFPGDFACVPPASRTTVRDENANANGRLANRGA